MKKTKIPYSRIVCLVIWLTVLLAMRGWVWDHPGTIRKIVFLVIAVFLALAFSICNMNNKPQAETSEGTKRLDTIRRNVFHVFCFLGAAWADYALLAEGHWFLALLYTACIFLVGEWCIALLSGDHIAEQNSKGTLVADHVVDTAMRDLSAVPNSFFQKEEQYWKIGKVTGMPGVYGDPGSGLDKADIFDNTSIMLGQRGEKALAQMMVHVGINKLADTYWSMHIPNNTMSQDTDVDAIVAFDNVILLLDAKEYSAGEDLKYAKGTKPNTALVANVKTGETQKTYKFTHNMAMAVHKYQEAFPDAIVQAEVLLCPTRAGLAAVKGGLTIEDGTIGVTQSWAFVNDLKRILEQRVTPAQHSQYHDGLLALVKGGQALPDKTIVDNEPIAKDANTSPNGTSTIYKSRSHGIHTPSNGSHPASQNKPIPTPVADPGKPDKYTVDERNTVWATYIGTNETFNIFWNMLPDYGWVWRKPYDTIAAFRNDDGKSADSGRNVIVISDEPYEQAKKNDDRAMMEDYIKFICEASLSSQLIIAVSTPHAQTAISDELIEYAINHDIEPPELQWVDMRSILMTQLEADFNALMKAPDNRGC